MEMLDFFTSKYSICGQCVAHLISREIRGLIAQASCRVDIASTHTLCGRWWHHPGNGPTRHGQGEVRRSPDRLPEISGGDVPPDVEDVHLAAYSQQPH